MSEAYDLKKIKKKLKNELDESRYEHTIGVMDTQPASPCDTVQT